ncbi:MAG TPA: (d)CMP kinase [Bryobacteraceae bacterium]|nr:(d)CMP kinase [Bryobacteraceae bacterium]
MSRRIVVAIDGPAGAGKSTVARRVADALGFVYIDSGAMYRAVALWALRRGVSDSDMHRLEQLAREADIAFRPGAATVLLNGEDVTEAIRLPEISAVASRVAAVSAVRRALVDKQRLMAAENSVVMEGRDIGTVVFPEAKVKIFLDAEPVVRTGRRVEELRGRGTPVNSETAARDIAERDCRDSTRPESPLMQAPDAMYLDSSRLSVDEVVEQVLRTVRERTANGKEVAR